jgi:hypothetical protein
MGDDDGSTGDGEGEGGTPGEQEPKETDVFAGLVLDDAFVRAAQRSEPPASQRAPTRPINQSQRRKRGRGGAGRARSWTHRHPGVVASVLVFVVILGVSAELGDGPLAPGSGFLQALHLSSRPMHGVPASAVPVKTTIIPSSKTQSPTRANTSGAPKSTTTTFLHLYGRSYQAGDCVTWNQNATDQFAATSVVSCARPHLIEVVSREVLAPELQTTYPSQSGWGQIFQSVCGPPAAKYLGYALYPDGRFYPSGIYPDLASWALGDHVLWCGISSRPSSFTPVATGTAPFTGVVRGQSQELAIPVGTCLGVGTTVGLPVPCTQSHLTEITGAASLAGVTDYPATPSAMGGALGDQCTNLAGQYVGGPLPPGIEAGWLQTSQDDWDAGERMVTCTVGAFDSSNNPVPRTGSLRG